MGLAFRCAAEACWKWANSWGENGRCLVMLLTFHLGIGECSLHSCLFTGIELCCPSRGRRSPCDALEIREVLSHLIHGERLW